jgi:hypothetical protein
VSGGGGGGATSPPPALVGSGGGGGGGGGGGTLSLSVPPDAPSCSPCVRTLSPPAAAAFSCAFFPCCLLLCLPPSFSLLSPFSLASFPWLLFSSAATLWASVQVPRLTSHTARSRSWEDVTRTIRGDDCWSAWSSASAL